jgi:hypothetical protein
MLAQNGKVEKLLSDGSSMARSLSRFDVGIEGLWAFSEGCVLLCRLAKGRPNADYKYLSSNVCRVGNTVSGLPKCGLTLWHLFSSRC